jgi:hypothetical protein
VIQTHRIHGHGDRRHRGIRLGAPTSPDARESFLTTFQSGVNEAYGVLREALSSGQIAQTEHDAFVLQVDAAEAEVGTLLSSGAAIETIQAQLDVQERRVLDLITAVRESSRSSQDAARLRMFWWSVAAVTIGLGAGFAWLAISKRKAK